MPLSPGVRLGPYEILDAIGAGGMGEVYRAKDTRLDRTVAIKTLPAHLSSDPLSKQRFEREAKTISSLNHPHICVLYDVGSQDGVDYLVMECFEGETLVKRLEKGALAAGASAEVRDANCGRAGQGTSQWRSASRPKTGQHHADVYGCEIAGFWVGQTHGATLQRGDTDGGNAKLAGDRAGHNRRNISIHVAGAN